MSSILADRALPDARHPGYRRGLILVLLAGACFSSMGLGIRLMEVANVWQILFYRSCALAPFLFVILSVRSGGTPFVVIRKAGLAALYGGVGLVFAFASGIYAIQSTTVANAMFLFASAPFFAALLGRLLLHENVRPATWVAMVFAMAGIAIMVVEGIAAGDIVGNIAAIISALGFAAFTIALRWRKLEDMLPAVLLAGVFAIVTAAMMCVVSGYSFVIPARDIGISLTLGVFQIGVGLTIYTIGSKSVPAAELALLSMTEVLLGPLWVWFFLGEIAGLYTLIGGAILLAAIAGNAISGLRRKPVPLV
ncbi:MAG: DMT family transporter [Gammaproteobacteria bacterium]|nr:DMT family transporter [Gammaproteobacteria bacterium]MDH3466823.1 DMT family transporter [Gammaproteobacteria bacterium]